MKILCTAPFLPFPPIDGGRIVAFHHLEGLARRGHELTMVYPHRRPEDAGGARHLEELGRVTLVPVQDEAVMRTSTSALAGNRSLRVARHAFPEMRAAIHGALAERHDAVLLDSLFTAYLLPVVREAAPGAPVVLFEHNVESQVFRRLVDHGSSAGWKILAPWELPRIEAAERRAAEGADRVLTLSREDADTLLGIAPDADVRVLGPGTRTTPGETIDPPEARETALFLGSYTWPPNRDGIAWMLRSIWPEVRRLVPGARLILAGNDPAGGMAELADPAAGVEARGFVEDVATTTREAGVCLVPLRYGGGIRLKILEALANERPVVSTGPGREGLPLTHGEHLLVHDDPGDFARAVASLLRDGEAARSLARSGRRRVEQTCSWEAVAGRMEATFEELVRG